MKTLLFFLASCFFLQAQEWSTNFEATIEKAITENKSVLLVFSGSDWCIPCIKLKKEILENEDFVSATKDDFLIVNADFPKKKKNSSQQSDEEKEQNKKLIATYNKQSYFPLVVVLSSDKTALGSIGYEKITPAEYAAKVKAFIPKVEEKSEETNKEETSEQETETQVTTEE